MARNKVKPAAAAGRKGTKPPARGKGSGKAGGSRLAVLGVILGGLAAGIAGLWAWTMPRGAHAWLSLGPDRGAIHAW